MKASSNTSKPKRTINQGAPLDCIAGHFWRALNLVKWLVSVLVKFKCGYLNSYSHRRTYMLHKFNWRVFNLAIYTKFAKLEASPKLPAIIILLW